MSQQQGEYKAGDAAIRFGAQVFKVQTLVDGGIRLTLDLVSPVLPETILQLFDAREPGVILECAAVAVAIEKQQENNAIRQGTKRKSSWQTAEG